MKHFGFKTKTNAFLEQVVYIRHECKEGIKSLLQLLFRSLLQTSYLMCGLILNGYLLEATHQQEVLNAKGPRETKTHTVAKR